MNTTRSHSKQPSPSDTEYEIARVRGDALVRCSPHCKQRVVQVPPAKSRSSRADTPSSISLATMAAIPASQESVNRVALDRTRSQPLNTFAKVREMVSIQRDGVQHFDPAKIITGAGVRVSDLSIDDALAELLGAIACTPQTADATDANLTGSMFAAFASADGSTAVKTAAAVAVICKLATERLWPATSDGVPHGGMRKLDGFLLLPIRKRHPAHPALSSRRLNSHPHTALSSRSINSHLHRQRRRRQKTACSGSTRATISLTRTTATRAELGRPCSPRSRRRAR